MAVDTQSTTGTPRTLKLSSHTIKEYSFIIQPPVHTERTKIAILTLSHDPCGQAVRNNVPAVNQPAISNMSVSYGNSPLLSIKAILNALVLSYYDDQQANLDL